MSQSSNAKQPKIFVAGSSWARGEWAPGEPRVQHDGVKQYFADAGYTVVDASQARSYHSRVIAYLDKKLKEHHKDNDIIFFIMADPLLDLIMPELAGLNLKRDSDARDLPEFTHAIKTAGGLINLIHQQQDQIYQQLDIVAKKYNTKIHCIGGTYNVNTNILSKYTDLLPIVVSWIHLLVGQYKEHPGTDNPEFGITYTWGIDYVDLSTYTPEFANQVRQEFDSISDSTRIMDELIFHPDGLHPNREGHTILYKHLTDLLHL
jgi:lysophospholipase L1-like esterase